MLFITLGTRTFLPVLRTKAKYLWTRRTCSSSEVLPNPSTRPHHMISTLSYLDQTIYSYLCTRGEQYGQQSDCGLSKVSCGCSAPAWWKSSQKTNSQNPTPIIHILPLPTSLNLFLPSFKFTTSSSFPFFPAYTASSCVLLLSLPNQTNLPIPSKHFSLSGPCGRKFHSMSKLKMATVIRWHGGVPKPSHLWRTTSPAW